MDRQSSSIFIQTGSKMLALFMSVILIAALSGCSTNEVAKHQEIQDPTESPATQAVRDVDFEAGGEPSEDAVADRNESQEDSKIIYEPEQSLPNAAELAQELGIVEDYREEFAHGTKTKEYQRYIMLHDTESDASPQSIVDYWDGADNGVAAHFVVGKDGTVVQCVPLDQIAHHAGYGDAGHNMLYGLTEDGRDDMDGTVPIGDWAPDYGMNAWSIGIEMVHVGGEGEYPEAQLEALDALVEYIDAYYGTESKIVDHKAWRTGNSDTSAEFASYLTCYQTYRTHDGE